MIKRTACRLHWMLNVNKLKKKELQIQRSFWVWLELSIHVLSILYAHLVRIWVQVQVKLITHHSKEMNQHSWTVSHWQSCFAIPSLVIIYTIINTRASVHTLQKNHVLDLNISTIHTSLRRANKIWFLIHFVNTEASAYLHF